jgi:hypothetical protein
MAVHKPTGWNTWDFRGFNRLVYLNRGHTQVIVQYAIWDEDYRPPDEVKNRGGLHHTFRWTDVTKLGPHAPLGLPARLDFQVGPTPFRAEAVDEHGTLRLTVTPLAETQMRVAFVFAAPIGETATTDPDAFAGCKLEFIGAAWPTDYFLNVAEPYALGQPGQPATIRVTPARANVTPPPGIDAPGTFEAFEKRCVSGTGALADAPQAMMQAVTWNTLFDARRRLVSSPVSRDWCADWKGVLVFCWDTYLVGTFVSYAAPELARLNFETVNAAIDELGHVPNYYMAHGAASRDRSMPPLGSYMIWKTQLANPDTAWLRRAYLQLARWHEYWMAHRDGNGDGLLEYGTDATPAYDFPQLRQDNPTLQHSAKCAMYEAALDNSPLYDDVPFNPQTNTLELSDVGLNSYYAMDCEALARMAEFLGRQSEAATYWQEYELIKQRINAHLWDEQHGIYCNRHWDGRFSSRWAPTSFYPLIAGVAPPDRAERMVHEHLLNDREFWGEYVIPSISRSDPAYPDNDYWRGRIWGPFNFLVAEGLRRYRFDGVAAQLGRQGLEMFMRNWREDGGVYENYNADTGRGADVWNAARLYHWGGLLAFIAMQELIDAEVSGYWRAGSLGFPTAGLRNVHVGGRKYDVDLDDGVHVRRDGQPFADCQTRAIIRIPLRAPADLPIEISSGNSGRLTLHAVAEPLPPARINGSVLVHPVGTPAVYVW